MWDLVGPPRRYCDGRSRRSFLRMGGLTVGGLSLPAILRAETKQASRSDQSVIMVYLTGGLSHQDSFDLKPNAPAEVRGEFRPIATNLPGVQIGELLPRLARRMDKIALIRSLVGFVDEHSSFQNLTGSTMGVSQRDGRPNIGSVISKMKGTTDPLLPAFVDLFPVMQHRPYNSPGAGRLGRVHSGVTVHGDTLAVMKPHDLPMEQLQDRRGLRARLDEIRRMADSAAEAGMEQCYTRAFDVLTSNRLVRALHLDEEPPRLRDQYGRGSPNHQGDGAPLWNDQLLLARRLVEAGIRCVTVAYGFWDTHGNNFGHLRGNLPVFDAGIAALIDDLAARGLDKHVTLLVWGEFGRTPKINANGGRDHWSPVNGALLAGGGLKVGQVIGSTDSIAGHALDRPIHFHDVLATVYQRLGIPADGFMEDLSGRPTAVLSPEAAPIAELV